MRATDTKNPEQYRTDDLDDLDGTIVSRERLEDTTLSVRPYQYDSHREVELEVAVEALEITTSLSPAEARQLRDRIDHALAEVGEL